MQKARKVLIAAIVVSLWAPLVHASVNVDFRDSITTIAPGAVGTFSGSDFSYGSDLYFTGSGSWSSQWSFESTASAISVTGFGGVNVTPTSLPAGTALATITATVPAGGAAGLDIYYSGDSSATPGASFLTTTMALNRYALTFAGGGVNGVNDGGTFDSTVRILGNWSSPSSHSALTFGAGYSLVQDFVYNGAFTTVEVQTTDYDGVNPSIDFTLYGNTAAVPEPGVWSLLCVGALVLFMRARRRIRGQSN